MRVITLKKKKKKKLLLRVKIRQKWAIIPFFKMFEKPRRGRQQEIFTTNVPKILDRLPNRYFPKIDVGCP